MTRTYQSVSDDSDRDEPIVKQDKSREPVRLTRAQIFRLLAEEDLSQLERGQPPIFTHYINPNLP